MSFLKLGLESLRNIDFGDSEVVKMEVGDRVFEVEKERLRLISPGLCEEFEENGTINKIDVSDEEGIHETKLSAAFERIVGMENDFGDDEAIEILSTKLFNGTLLESVYDGEMKLSELLLGEERREKALKKSDKFEIAFGDEVIEVGFLRGSILSKRMNRDFSVEGKRGIRIEIPSNVERDEFKRIMRRVESLTRGMRIQFSNDELSTLLYIGQELENNEIVKHCLDRMFDIPTEKLNEVIEQLTDDVLSDELINKLATQFKTFEEYESRGKRYHPKILKRILSSLMFKIESRDEIANILIDSFISTNFEDESLLEDIDLLHLKPSTRQRFFDIIELPFVTTKTFRNIVSFAKEHSKHEMETSAKEVSNHNISKLFKFDPNNKNAHGLIAHRKSENKSVKVTASTELNDSRNATNVLNWNDNSWWCSKNPHPNQWISFDFECLFKLETIVIWDRGLSIPRSWEILGSVESEGEDNWEMVLNIENETRFYIENQIVPIEVGPTKPYRRFKFYSKAGRCNEDNLQRFAFRAVEFYGAIVEIKEYRRKCYLQ